MSNTLLNRKYFCKEDIFDKLDTPAKSYWLGVLYADGSVDKRGYYTAFTTKDLDWITQFKVFMKSEHKIRLSRGTYEIVIGSQYLNKSLQNHGIIPNKTYNYTIPISIPSGELESHFWRGLIDGDGCIGFYPKINRSYLILTWCNYELLVKCKNFFGNIGGIYKTKSKHPHFQWSYNTRSTYKMAPILGNLYNKSSLDIRLNRKYNVYEDICNYAM